MNKKQRKRDLKQKRKQDRIRSDLQQYALSAIALRDGEFPTAGALLKSELNEDAFASEKDARLFFALVNLASRVQDHINRIDSGVVYAVDDLAVALRVLLRAGEGSGILLTALQEFELDTPMILASKQVPIDADFGFGLLPIVDTYPGILPVDGESDTVIIGIQEWLTFAAIRYRDETGAVTSKSWKDFIGHYANRLSGAHLDVRPVPAYIDRMDWCGAGGLSLSGYLLRCLGVQAFYLVQEALHEICEKREVDISDTHTFGSPGCRGSIPEAAYHLGELFRYSVTDSSVTFHWVVDDCSKDNRLRLFFNHAIWDFEYSSDRGLLASKHSQPISKYMYQASRFPIYPTQGLGDLHASRPFVHLPKVQTVQQLRADVPWQWPDDFHPNVPAPNWNSTLDLTPGIVATTPEFADEMAALHPDRVLPEAPN